MSTILFILLSFLFLNSSYSQDNDLRKMSRKQRREYLCEKAKEVTINFAPTYYREHGKPKIEGTFKFESKNPKNATLIGRKYYIVTLPYDPNKDVKDYKIRFVSKVYIWEGNGEPFKIKFSHGISLLFYGDGIGHTYSERVAKGIKEEDQMKLIDPDDYGPNVLWE